MLARASILHDENNYRQELEKSSEFAPRRQQAFAEFQKAAQLYTAAVPSLPQDEQNTQVYELWFSAGLGACDLQHITEETLPDDRQPPLIRQSLESLKGEDRERHMSKFANALFTRLNAVKPSVKVRYLKGGFEIVGDHPQAHDARKVYDYYKDLVTEIKLETSGRRQRRGRPREAVRRVRQPPPHPGDRARIGRVRPLSPEPEQLRILLLQLRPAAGELPRQVPGDRQAGAPGAVRGRSR